MSGIYNHPNRSVPNLPSSLLSSSTPSLTITNNDGVSVHSVTYDSATKLPLAASKENIEFHSLFPLVDDSDRLITYYSCALQADVLIQGKLYISQHHLCFRGWKNNPIQIHFKSISFIEKKNIALVIPNSVEIGTADDKKYFFATLFARDETFAVLTMVWNANLYPQNAEILNADCQCNEQGPCENCLTNKPGSHTLKRKLSFRRKSRNSNSSSSSQIGSPSYTKLLGDDLHYSTETLGNRRGYRSDGGSNSSTVPRIKKISSFDKLIGREALDNSLLQRLDDASIANDSDYIESPSKGISDSEYINAKCKERSAKVIPLTQVDPIKPKKKFIAESCDCAPKHAEMNTLLDKVYGLSFAEVFDLLYGTGKENESFNESFFGKFLIEERKATDLLVSNWSENGVNNTAIHPSDPSLKSSPFSEIQGDWSRKINFIIPTGQSVGQATTLCKNEETILQKTDSYVCIKTKTSTPNVPTGGSFHTAVKICLKYAGKNKTRVLVSARVEFTKSSWIKGIIEDKAMSGCKSYYEKLDLYLSSYIHSLRVPRPASYDGSPLLQKEVDTASIKSKRRSWVSNRPNSYVDTDHVPNVRNGKFLFWVFVFVLLNVLVLMTMNIFMLWRVTSLVSKYEERIEDRLFKIGSIEVLEKQRLAWEEKLDNI